MRKRRKKKAPDKGAHEKHLIIISSLIIIIFALSSIVILQLFGIISLAGIQAGSKTADLNIDLIRDIEQLTPKEKDFPNIEGGTLTGWAGSNYYKEPIDEVVVLFASAKVPGLAIIYYPYHERLVAGTPQMTVEGIKLFKGEEHQIVYSFDRGRKQKIYYDGELKAETDFEIYFNELMGMVIGSPETVVSPSFKDVIIEEVGIAGDTENS